MRSIFTILALLVAYTQAQAAPPASSIKIGATSYSGTGCPKGSVSSILSDARDLVTFGFDSFQATIGPKSPPADSRKNCNLRLQLLYQDGYQMAIAETVYHGYTRLDDGVNARFTTDYDYASNPNPGKKGHAESSIGGEVGAHTRRAKEFKHNHKHSTDTGPWSHCGKDANLIVENSLVLTSRNKSASGEFAVDDETVQFRQKMSLTWKKCK